MRIRSWHVVRRWLALAVLVASAGACRSGPATLSDLAEIDELKNQFNRDAGAIRIVLLLSPT